MALLNQFINFDPIIDSLWVKVEPKFDELAQQVLAMLPVIGAAAAKAVIDKFPDLIRAILASDPDIPILSDIFDLSEAVTNSINDDPRIPVQLPGLDMLGKLFKEFGGR